VVPGGGPFADLVRELDPPPDAAHWMACAAMEQVGLYLAGFGLPSTDTLRTTDTPAVLLPYRLLQDHDPLPHTWRITSDTLAAWCAAELGYDLLLAKSIAGIVAGGRLLETVTAPVETDAVDPCLVPFVLDHGVDTRIVNARVPGRLGLALRDEPVPGTRIDPSLFVDRT
jgi:aspartokinase-like uncharacterized kinase